jgi:hypothetical protein
MDLPTSSEPEQATLLKVFDLHQQPDPLTVEKLTV